MKGISNALQEKNQLKTLKALTGTEPLDSTKSNKINPLNFFSIFLKPF